tara:strand:- start:1956 stop:2108 length:153 start_codon:yes stop_codon:yes gene_type:complete
MAQEKDKFDMANFPGLVPYDQILREVLELYENGGVEPKKNNKKKKEANNG